MYLQPDKTVQTVHCIGAESALLLVLIIKYGKD